MAAESRSEALSVPDDLPLAAAARLCDLRDDLSLRSLGVATWNDLGSLACGCEGIARSSAGFGTSSC